MSYLARELARLNGALCDDPTGARYPELYAAQQALAWALEPTVTQSPSAYLISSGGDVAGCSANDRPEMSLETECQAPSLRHTPRPDTR